MINVDIADGLKEFIAVLNIQTGLKRHHVFKIELYFPSTLLCVVLRLFKGRMSFKIITTMKEKRGVSFINKYSSWSRSRSFLLFSQLKNSLLC